MACLLYARHWVRLLRENDGAGTPPSLTVHWKNQIAVHIQLLHVLCTLLVLSARGLGREKWVQ